MSENAREELTSTTIRKKNLLAALEKSLGVVNKACKEVEVSRETFYAWKREDEEFRKAYEDLKNVALDFAESKLFEKMNGVEMVKFDSNGEAVTYTLPPSDTALIFYLKTQGKDRGYIERQELTGKDGDDLYKSMSDEEIDKQLNGPSREDT